MADLTFEDLRSVNLTRCQRWHPTGIVEWSMADWLVALGGEVGEACNIVKKLNRDAGGMAGNTKGRAALAADLADELADAAIYLDIVKARCDLASLGEHMGGSDPVTRFGALRIGTVASYFNDPAATLSDAAVELLESLGALCREALSSDTSLIGYNIDGLLVRLDEIAAKQDIDLAAAIVSKFNRTSERFGFPERLEVA